MKATTLGDLRATPWSTKSGRSVKQELRDNLICLLKENKAIFPGIVGYENSVTPQIVNALLSRHNFILSLPHAKTRRYLYRAYAPKGN